MTARHREAVSRSNGARRPEGSIFPSQSLRRDESAWEDYLGVPTPVEERGHLLYKREDYFAPLGYGGVNGSKLRQLIFLIGRYHREGGRAGVITAASLLSPQLSMTALVARHYGLPAVLVLGGSRPDTAFRAENGAIAAAAGAAFSFIPVGYTPALQRAVRDLHDTPTYQGWYRLRYGITTPEEADPFDVEAFHSIGAGQAVNIPRDCRQLVMTAGSCNSCVSVLYGIARGRAVLGDDLQLERVLLLGIGPTRLQWIEDRLAQIEAGQSHAPDCDLDEDCSCGALTDIRGLFRRRYHDHPALEDEHQTDGPILLEHVDLHKRKFAAYGDRMPWRQDGIDFHPTYEGKMLTFLNTVDDVGGALERDGRTLIWIVGSAPSRAAMSAAFLLDGLR